MTCMILDIDGTLLEQNYDSFEKGINQTLTAGTSAKLREWEKKNYKIVLITGRKESSRKITEQTLENLGVCYDHLIMGVGIGPRILVNDLKPEHPDLVMAQAINLKRNEGIGNIKV